MKIVRFRLKKLILCSALGVIAGSSPLAAQEVILTKDWSAKRWENYPESVGKIISKWDACVLNVRVVINWHSGIVIDEHSAKVSIRDSTLHLSYCERNSKEAVGSIVSPGVIAPLLLNFKISGIPKAEYLIQVSTRDCQESPNGL